MSSTNIIFLSAKPFIKNYCGVRSTLYPNKSQRISDIFLKKGSSGIYFKSLWTVYDCTESLLI